jgi:YggT family protein
MAIPGNGIAEQVFVGGFSNFLSIYNLIITARILLSWFPQAQGVAALQPVYAITDPFLNLFRGVVPPLFGLDFSPILAFFLLNVVTNATAAVGSTLPQEKLVELRRLQQQRNTPVAAILGRSLERRMDPSYVSMNL